MGSKIAQKEKVVVAMSGGVDSSVAACLLAEQGYEVMGLFMRVGAEAPPATCKSSEATRDHQGCCSASDAADARFVAGMIDAPFYALNFQQDFDRIIDYFCDEYVQGRTPNPCIVCNNDLKFGKVVDYADAVGARYIATGHYARIARSGGQTMLLRGRDRKKDQSYVLFGLEPEVLDRVMFPVGELTKAEVREAAARFKLPNRGKPDSVEICFVPDREYARIVQERRPTAFAEGDVVDQSGQVVGRHRGIGRYTIGQRRGLGIAAGKPIYVTNLNVAGNLVTIGEQDDLLCRHVVARGVRFLQSGVDGQFRADVQIRYLHTAAPALVETVDKDTVHITFDEPQLAITPGQAIVFYDGDAVIGGAWIDSAQRGDEEKRVPPAVG